MSVCVCVRVLFIASMHEHMYICALRIILNHSSTILTDLEFLNLAQSSLMWFWRSRLRSSHSHGKGFPHWTTHPAQKSSLTLVCSRSLSLPPKFTPAFSCPPAPFLCPATWAGYRLQAPAPLKLQGRRGFASTDAPLCSPLGSHHSPSFLLPGFVHVSSTVLCFLSVLDHLIFFFEGGSPLE